VAISPKLVLGQIPLSTQDCEDYHGRDSRDHSRRAKPGRHRGLI
jgi:hypothetical protein